MAPRKVKLDPIRAASIVSLLQRSPGSVGSTISTAASSPELENMNGGAKGIQARNNKRKVGFGETEPMQKKSNSKARTEKDMQPTATVVEVQGDTEFDDEEREGDNKQRNGGGHPEDGQRRGEMANHSVMLGYKEVDNQKKTSADRSTPPPLEVLGDLEFLAPFPTPTHDAEDFNKTMAQISAELNEESATQGGDELEEESGDDSELSVKEQLKEAVASGHLDTKGGLGQRFKRELSEDEAADDHKLKTDKARAAFRLDWGQRRLSTMVVTELVLGLGFHG